MTRREAVGVWAEKWRHLQAWGRPLEEVQIDLRRDDGRGRLGWCHQCSRRIVVKCRTDMVDTLDTVLHELAHAANPGEFEDHGERWREVYARAVEEVTGRAIPGAGAEDEVGVRALALEALRGWWRESGLENVWKMMKLKGE